MKKTELSPTIILYEDAFKESDIISLLEDECRIAWGYVGWAKTEVGSGVNQVANNDYRSAMGCSMGPLSIPVGDVSVERLIPLVTAWGKIVESVQSCIGDYREEYQLSLKADEGFAVLKYGHGAQYKGHVDHASENQRVLSVIGFLNEDFSGGELVFPIFDVTIKPKKGSVVLFPSNFPFYHYVSPVGVADETLRYSFSTWLN